MTTQLKLTPVQQKDKFNFVKETLQMNDKRIWCQWRKSLYERLAKDKLSIIFNTDITENLSVIISRQEVERIQAIQKSEYERNMSARPADLFNETNDAKLTRLQKEKLTIIKKKS